MNFQDIVPFLKVNHRGVISTKQSNGATHSSIVVCGTYKGNAAFVSVYPKSQKVKNLRRNPDCTVVSVSDDWRSYAVIEGEASLFDFSNTDADTLRLMLREVYMVCSNTPHPNWEEYDSAMVKQEAVVVLVNPSRIYGQLRLAKR
jgi:PPOX class probable F420-dependent enzyme